MTYFENKTIVVIGATGVFGSHVARSLHQQGADVRLIVRNPRGLDETLGRLPVAVASISDRGELESAFTEVSLGRPVDGIINCAGVVAFGAFNDLSERVGAELMAVNAIGTMNVIRLAGEGVNPDGFLASFTGVAADMAIAGMGAYCASKVAAKTAMAVATRELRAKKIKVLDVRAPHSETGLVNRALEGTAPKMPLGLEPQVVVDRVLEAIAHGEKDLPAEAFIVTNA
jgi:cyclic-di-GMP-binding biofilm dispersal mediator protein